FPGPGPAEARSIWYTIFQAFRGSEPRGSELSVPHPHLAVETSPAGYRWVRLSRPERRNALDMSLLRAVTAALALRLVNRVCDDPEPAAAQIAASLAGRGTGPEGSGAGVKAVMAAGGPLDRRRAERAADRS